MTREELQAKVEELEALIQAGNGYTLAQNSKLKHGNYC